MTHLNLRTYADCLAYVDKLAHYGTNAPGMTTYISAKAAGYLYNTYVFDDIRTPTYAPYPFGPSAIGGVLAAGAQSNDVLYVEAVEGDGQTEPAHILCATNVAGYASWGAHGFLYSGSYTNGTISFRGTGGWFLVQTIESYNGRWYPNNYEHNSFQDWFEPLAFREQGAPGDYAYTAVGAVSHTDEPGSVGSVNNSGVLFGLWQAGKCFAICAWESAVTPNFQTTGDPLVRH